MIKRFWNWLTGSSVNLPEPPAIMRPTPSESDLQRHDACCGGHISRPNPRVLLMREKKQKERLAATQRGKSARKPVPSRPSPRHETSEVGAAVVGAAVGYGLGRSSRSDDDDSSSSRSSYSSGSSSSSSSDDSDSGFGGGGGSFGGGGASGDF
jgi:uncharacterized membrane protein YgcG